MAKKFDAALKELIDGHDAEWGRYLAARVGVAAPDPEIIESDVSSVTMQADKVFHLGGDAGLLHAELQSSWEGDVPDVLLGYNVFLDRRYGPPVKSVVVLLRPEANATNITGRLQRVGPDGEVYLDFTYAVIRVWEEPLEALLNAGLGLLPLALLTDEARADLPAAFQQVEERLKQANLPAEKLADLRAISFVLLGLRYVDDVIRALFRGVAAMEESTTYQYILRQGAAREAQKLLLRHGARKWGPPGEDILATVRGINDLDRLERMDDALPTASSWQELLATP
jgi:hypothetical protein